MFDHAVDFPNDIEPCPFCGQEAPHIVVKRTDTLKIGILNLFRVSCLSCLTQGPYAGANTAVEAERLWNDRIRVVIDDGHGKKHAEYVRKVKNGQAVIS